MKIDNLEYVKNTGYGVRGNVGAGAREKKKTFRCIGDWRVNFVTLISTNISTNFSTVISTLMFTYSLA